jgi:hypothetical protein
MILTLEEDRIRREEVLREAVGAANRIIMEGSQGSEEETNYLTAMTAQEFLKSVLIPIEHALLKKDAQKED